MVKTNLKMPVISLLIVLSIAVAYDGLRLLDERRFNDALVNNDPGDDIDESTNPYHQFARAHELQQQGSFREAVKAYAAIESPPSSSMRIDVTYNLANLYFREANRMRANAADDLAMPLIELAKQNYKEILRIDSRHWNAKYNLELALILSPELDPADAMEERNPEHSTRALTTIQSREPLP